MERPHDMGIGRSRQGGIERSTIESVATESDVGSGARPGLAAIVWGGLPAGGLDITAAFVIYGLRGASPVRILQSIASGLLGAAAFQGGVAVYVFMNFVVLPLSAVAKRPFVLELALVILAVHMVFVGLPIALAVRRWAPFRPPARAAP
jgi:hypothetical protein